jgi:MULE transposase domain
METQYRDSLPDIVRSAFDKAVEALPPEHRRAPTTGDEVNNPEEALCWFQNYAFTQGFCLVTSSKARDRLRVACIHHGKKTRNTRKLAETVTDGGDRKKELTYIKAKECPYSLYVSYKTVRGGLQGVEERKAWLVSFTCSYHTHPPIRNPFHYVSHRSRIPERARAVELTQAHRDVGLSASKSARILDQHGLGKCLSAKEFYNLNRSEGRQSDQEALDLLLTCLEFEDFRVRCYFKYLLDGEGRRTARVLEHLFFCSSEQIRLGRRFVSGFVMQTDATFNTNKLHLPLSVIVGITNTGKTFPLAFAFIASESAEAFEFVNAQLAELVWYDCPPPQVVLGDQTKGLTAAMDMAIRDKAQDGSQQILQLCEWHAAQNFKKRLIDVGKYTKEQREELIKFVWNYIQSPNKTELGSRRDKLLAELHEPERRYLQENWEPKECQFVRAYTRGYPNLGCNSTQRNESYHVVVKESLNRQLPLQKACQKLAEDLKKLATRIAEDEDRSRVDLPRLLDRTAFGYLIGTVPHYVLGMLAPEWEAAKALRWGQEGAQEGAQDLGI